MLKISIDNQAIKDDFGSFAFYAKKHNLSRAELSQTRLYMREANASLNQLITDGYVTVKEVTDKRKSA